MSSEIGVPEGHEFALCLTHDVDKPYKTWLHGLFYASLERDPDHLRALDPSHNPYWQFDTITELEADLGVRSAFYFLTGRRLRELSPGVRTDPATLVQQIGRYDVASPDIARMIRGLDRRGWEVGLHGSYHTATEPDRLAYEKDRLEGVLGHDIVGGRQHYLRFSEPETWRHYADMGLRYDASLGSTTEYGFQYGYDVRHPFDDEFAVFPLTVMEQTLPDPGEQFQAAREACESMLREAADNHAVMTALWHPRYFHEGEFPGYRRLYRYLVERAREMDAWVGSPGQLYEPSNEAASSRQRVESS